MVTLSVTIEAQEGLTWPRWRRMVEQVEALRFAGLHRSDHLARVTPVPATSLIRRPDSRRSRHSQPTARTCLPPGDHAAPPSWSARQQGAVYPIPAHPNRTAAVNKDSSCRFVTRS